MAAFNHFSPGGMTLSDLLKVLNQFDLQDEIKIQSPESGELLPLRSIDLDISPGNKDLHNTIVMKA